MKKRICAFLSILMILALLVPVLTAGAESEPSALSTATVGGEEFTVMSLNIRYSTSSAGYASLKWVVGTDESGEYILRVDNAIAEILKASPDIIGFQEYNFTGNSDVDTKLTEALTAAGYGIVMQYYSDGTTHNQTPIFYKTDKFQAVTETGAQGILQYTHHENRGITTTEKIHVQVVKSGSVSYTRTKTTAGGASVSEYYNRTAGTVTYTAAEVATGNYLDLTNFSSMSGVTFNSNGTVTYNSKTYSGAYHTRARITSSYYASAGKSLTWGVLQHKASGQRILMMSTHMAVWLTGFATKSDDYTSALVQKWNTENAKELLATAETVYSTFGHLPTIAVGDFNMRNNHPTYNTLCTLFDDSARLAPDAIYWESSSLDMDGVKTLITNQSGSAVTHNGDKLYDVRVYREEKAPTPGYPIDHIFCSRGDLEVRSYNVLNDTPEQRVISDHYALMTTFVLPDVQTPTCSHKSDVYRLEQSVTLTKGNTSDVIYYTLDGSDPTSSETRKTYTGALKLYGDVQLRAVSYRGGQYSPERTVNFATGAELMVTEYIKNNQSTNVLLPDGTKAVTYAELFAGFEVVNTSAHSIDLGRYTYWQKSASTSGINGDADELANLDAASVTGHLFVTELGKYILEPGETAFIWFIHNQVYGFKLIYDAAGNADYAVDFVTAENYESLGYPATAIGKAIYNTEVAKKAFEYATGSTVTVDLIVPLDRTASSYAPNYDTDAAKVLSTRFQRTDAKSAAFSNLSNYIDHAGTYFSRTFITHDYEISATDAFTSALVACTNGWNTAESGSAWSLQGSFYLTNTVDQASGKITGTATTFTLKQYGLGALGEGEAEQVANFVRDLSKRKVMWSVNGTETTEYVLRNAVPTFAGSTHKPNTATQSFVFKGWSPTPAACAVDSTGTYLVATDATYVAQYSESHIEYLITFLDASGGTHLSEQIRINGTYTLSDAPEGTGVFVGWRSADGDFLGAGASYTVTHNVTFSPVFVSFTTLSGASVRTTTGTTGLRFRSTLAKSDYEMLTALSGNLAFGTYIVPQSYVDQTGSFDVSKFPMHLDVATDGWYQTTESDFVIAGSIANIKTQNYLRAFTACAYITITYSDGTTGRVLAVREANKGYSVYETAYAAYNDRTAESDSTHGFEIDGAAGISYSPYTATQLRTIRTFIDPVLYLGIRDGAVVSIADTDYYTSPLAACEWTYDEARDRIVITAADADTWSTVFACFMEDEVSDFSVSGATLYVEYNIYSDFY